MAESTLVLPSKTRRKNVSQSSLPCPSRLGHCVDEKIDFKIIFKRLESQLSTTTTRPDNIVGTPTRTTQTISDATSASIATSDASAKVSSATDALSQTTLTTTAANTTSSDTIAAGSNMEEVTSTSQLEELTPASELQDITTEDESKSESGTSEILFVCLFCFFFFNSALYFKQSFIVKFI